MQRVQIRLSRGVTVRGPQGNRYMIEGLLGEGQGGAVYLARDRHARHHLFALKEVITPNKGDRERFIFEGQILRRLSHRALPRVYQLFEHDKLKRVYLLMDYIQGRNLEALRREQPGQRFPLLVALALMAPVVDALIYLHRQDPPVVHRDIKPANIIVPPGADEAVLVDFGSAKEYMPGTNTVVVGHQAPGYASPEQYSSGTTPRTDIYGLGATLYTLLTGAVPPDAITRATRRWTAEGDPLRSADLLAAAVPPAVAQALGRAMALSSAERFETVEAFWDALSVHAAQQPVQVSGSTPGDTFRPLSEQDTERLARASVLTQRHVPRVFQRWKLLLPSLLAIIALSVAFFLHRGSLTVVLLLGLGVLILLSLLWLARR